MKRSTWNPVYIYSCGPELTIGFPGQIAPGTMLPGTALKSVTQTHHRSRSGKLAQLQLKRVGVASRQRLPGFQLGLGISQVPDRIGAGDQPEREDSVPG